jgi:transcriptional regulator with XRE-family HTH domain
MTTPKAATPGATIYHARSLRGLSQAELAESVGVDAKMFARIEANQIPLDVDLAMRLGSRLSIDAKLLLPDFARLRIYEGKVAAQTHFLVGDSQILHEPWWWVEGLEAKRVRVTVEVLDAPAAKEKT